MRARFFRFTTVALAIAAATACASSEDEVSPSPGPDGGGQITLGDGGERETDASVDRAAPGDATVPDGTAIETCSGAGWCLTELPDPDLNVSDIWPFEKIAFASVFSTARGRKIIEWNEDDPQGAKWRYIDDNSQQDIPGGTFENIWAPNEDEIYYTATPTTNTYTGFWGGILFHGKRPAPPATEWTWTNTRFDCPIRTNPRVFGIGSDVYVLSCQKIYRLTGDPDAVGAIVVDDAGSSPWTLEYTDDDATSLQFKGGFGTPDDIFFVGWRGTTCTTIVRRTANGYQRIVDGVVSGTKCNPKPGHAAVPKLNDFISTRPGEIVGTTTTRGLAKVTVDADGGVSFVEANPGPPAALTAIGSIWSDSPDEIWLVGSSNRILHGTGVWSDAASYQYSTIALNGLPNESTLARIRGISKSNLWATGSDRAFHKTTP